ncbi:MAG: hypothetical protein JWM09_932 [Francisellaceae bacterium]|nr:hypothetical protein [Francisellaceae bacterium]
MWLILLIVSMFVISFASLNATLVPVHYYVGSKNLPLSLLLISSFIIGIFFGLLVQSIKVIRLKIENKWLKYKLEGKEKKEILEKEAVARDAALLNLDHSQGQV